MFIVISHKWYEFQTWRTQQIDHRKKNGVLYLEINAAMCQLYQYCCVQILLLQGDQRDYYTSDVTHGTMSQQAPILGGWSHMNTPSTVGAGQAVPKQHDTDTHPQNVYDEGSAYLGTKESGGPGESNVSGGSFSKDEFQVEGGGAGGGDGNGDALVEGAEEEEEEEDHGAKTENVRMVVVWW